MYYDNITRTQTRQMEKIVGKTVNKEAMSIMSLRVAAKHMRMLDDIRRYEGLKTPSNTVRLLIAEKYDKLPEEAKT